MKHIFTLFLILVGFLSFGQGPNTSAIAVPFDASGGTHNALLTLPDDYNSTSTRYPLLMFFHGAGESAGTLATIYTSSTAGGPAYFNATGAWPTSFVNPRDGLSYKFIVVSPQGTGGGSTDKKGIDSALNYIIRNYRVDTTRLYLTGLSRGAGPGIAEYIGNFLYTRKHKIAAFIPMSAEMGQPQQSMIDSYVADSSRGWGFGSYSDGLGTQTRCLIWGSFSGNCAGLTGSLSSGGKFTDYIGGHCCWNQFFNPTYRESINPWYGGVAQSMSIYEWMLQFKQSYGNTPPIVSAGSNQTITLPTNTATLTGTASDPGGSITSYLWEQTSGTNAGITSPGSSSTGITGLNSAGARIFRLTATDNLGLSSSSSMTVTVNAAGNIAPTANAGTDQAITLPTNTVTLSGSGTDADGTIASYAWTQVSGNAASITSPTSASTTITNLVTAGICIFRLTVTDNQGSIGTDDITITINGGSQPTTKVVNVNIYGTAIYSNSAWNNWNIVSSLTSPSLNYSDGSSAGVTSILSSQAGYSDNGPDYLVTMCPQVVGRDASYATSTRTLTINGLSNSKYYDLALYATRGNSGQNTRFTVEGNSIDISTNFNYTNAATFSNILPTTNSIVVSIINLNGYNYINGYTLTEKTSVGNISPTANAGSNQTITLPTSTTTLVGTGSDADGSITNYTWSQVSGTTASISTPSASTTNITGLTTAGVRIFRLTVTDDKGGTGTNDVTITVNTAGNINPVANAGSDKNITLPTSATTLSGSATDADGTISTYAWTQISGTSATISTASTATTNITGLTTTGTRVFRLTVTDNNGGTNTDDVSVIVTDAPADYPIYQPSASKVITSVGLGEYSTVYLTNEEKVYGILFVSGKNKFTDFGFTGVKRVAGMQYRNIILLSDGTVRLIRKGGDGLQEITTIPIDTSGAAFNKNAKVFGFWQSAYTIDSSGRIWYIGFGNNLSYGSLQLGSGQVLTKPMLLTQPGGGRKIIDIAVMDRAITTLAVTMCLCDDGSVWTYSPGSLSPTQVSVPGGAFITGIATISRAAYVLYSNTVNKIYAWGPYASYMGTTDGSTTPQDVTSQWTSVGLTFPIKEAASNWNTIHFIDANDDLYARGDNMQGEIGNGENYIFWSTYKNGTSSSRYGWDQVRGQYLKAPTKIPGKFKNIQFGPNIAFYFYIQDMNNNWYSWGRNKVNSLGNAQRTLNDDAYPNALDIPAPTFVSPSSSIQPADFVFNPTLPRLPLANAGVDLNIVIDSINLTGSLSSQQGGSLTDYIWSNISGPTTPTILNPSNSNVTAKGLQTGVYLFKLTVTNDNGISAVDTIRVAVTLINNPPVVNAGVTQTIFLPTNTATLTGVVTDTDGTIASYLWTQISGPNTATIGTSTLISTTVSNLVTGTYIFKLRATDNLGSIGENTVIVLVTNGRTIIKPRLTRIKF